MAIVQEEQDAGIPEWVVTFGDMMSLLLTFFIMLFSMSEMKEDQANQAVLEALHQRFGYDTSVLSTSPGHSKPRSTALVKLASLGRARRDHTLSGGAKVKAPVGHSRLVKTIRQANQATNGGVILFPEGLAVVTERDRRTLEGVAEEIGGKPQKIEIRGHTTTRPLPADSLYKTHRDLAYARCRNVMDVLIDLGIKPRRIRLSVSGDTEPKQTRPDPLLLKENARVEIYMLNELTKDLRGPPKRVGVSHGEQGG